MGKSQLELDVSGLEAKLEALGGSQLESTSVKNAEAAAQILVNEIKRRAPVDTGALRDSYRYRVYRSDRDTWVAVVGTDIFYAVPQEYIHTPHVRPSVEARRDEITKILAADTIRDTIEVVER